MWPDQQHQHHWSLLEMLTLRTHPRSIKLLARFLTRSPEDFHPHQRIESMLYWCWLLSPIGYLLSPASGTSTNLHSRGLLLVEHLSLGCPMGISQQHPPDELILSPSALPVLPLFLHFWLQWVEPIQNLCKAFEFLFVLSHPIHQVLLIFFFFYNSLSPPPPFNLFF